MADKQLPPIHTQFMLVSDIIMTSGVEFVKGKAAGRDHLGALCLGLAIELLLAGVDCAFMASLRFEMVTALGFLAGAGANVRLLLKRGAACQKAAREALAESRRVPSSSSTASQQQLVQRALQLASSSQRLAVGGAVCAVALANGTASDSELWLARVWLLHLALMRAMPLQQRCIRPRSSSHVLAAAAAPEFAQRVMECIPDIIRHLPSEASQSQGMELVDCYDTHFFANLVTLLVQHGSTDSSSLPAIDVSCLARGVVDEWREAVEIMQSLVGRQNVWPLVPSGDLKAIDGLSISGTGVADYTPALISAARIAHSRQGVGQAAALLGNAFISDVLNQTGCEEFVTSVTAAAGLPGEHQIPPASMPLFLSSQPYQEVYHWHSRRPMEPAFISQVRLLAVAACLPELV
jgi:hypothetical protein